jgi:hypothetical protein
MLYFSAYISRSPRPDSSSTPPIGLGAAPAFFEPVEEESGLEEVVF